MELAIEITMKLILAVLAMALYGGWKVRDKLKVFDMSIFIKENKAFWIWSLSLIIIILAILTIEPDAGEALKTMTGLDVNNTKASFLTLGWALSILANQVTNNPIGKKPIV